MDVATSLPGRCWAGVDINAPLDDRG